MIVIFRIKIDCNSVLYKQIEAWTLHGVLMDPAAEFFIQEVRVSADVSCYSSYQFHHTDNHGPC